MNKSKKDKEQNKEIRYKHVDHLNDNGIKIWSGALEKIKN